jgi:eukaryotic-like serine/threonine-protein kinase
MNADQLPGGERRPEMTAHRVDEACDRFEAAWRAGRAPRIEEYLESFGEHERMALLRQLVPLEWELRHKGGERPDPEKYRRRFPAEAEQIGTVFALWPVRHLVAPVLQRTGSKPGGIVAA